MKKRKRSIPLNKPLVVGTIHTREGFAFASRSGIDVAEVRLDLLPVQPPPGRLASLPVPVILTLRRRDEGGACTLPPTERSALCRQYLDAIEAVDIESRSLRSMRKLVSEAREKNLIVVVSYHDFASTPSLSRLRQIVSSSREAGADVVKIAAHTAKPADVARLLDLLGEASAPLSVMGMGELGRASRLLFARAGSLLNYGWLHKPLVHGQWSAKEFGQLLARA